jgi:hypothetical protein
MRHHEADMRRQDVQQAVFLPGQSDLAVVERYASSDKIDRKGAGSYHRTFRRGLEISPQCSFAAREQFGHAERFDDVIVSARTPNTKSLPAMKVTARLRRSESRCHFHGRGI